MDRNSTSTHSASFADFASALSEKPLLNEALMCLEKDELSSNNLIYMIWHARQSAGRVNKFQIKSIIRSLAYWHERITQHLLHWQTKMRAHPHPACRQINHWVEREWQFAVLMEREILNQHKVHQVAHMRTPSQQLNDACYNIAYYCKQAHKILSEKNTQAISIILQTVFDEVNSGMVDQAMEQYFRDVITGDTNFAQLSLQSL